jgi:hypothetical protein
MPAPSKLALAACAALASAWSPPAEVESAAMASHWAVLVAGSSGYAAVRAAR